MSLHTLRFRVLLGAILLGIIVLLLGWANEAGAMVSGSAFALGYLLALWDRQFERSARWRLWWAIGRKRNAPAICAAGSSASSTTRR